MLRSVHFRVRRPLLVGIAAAALLTSVALGAGSASASASPEHSNQPSVRAGSDYLALGDSVSFGYREATNLPTPDYTNAANFTGYPEDVADGLGLNVANAACPGETSTSFIKANVTSNGCENSPTGPVGYRTAFPLHVSYAGTQLTYAVGYLRTHPGTRLVSLMIGANDGFLCEETTADGCASELPATLAQVAANVRTILFDLRYHAGYRGQIVIVNYYSLDYSSAAANASSQGLNAAMDTAAKPFNVRIADGFGIFQKAAAQAGGNSCTAGLLTTLTTGGCGVHPSVGGQALLALAVEKAISH
jgi:lysophospholipase L1-like esterase